MKVAFETLGCKVNQYDSNAMMQLLQGAGYEAVPFEECADVYIINTCTVTNVADKKSRNFIRRARRNNAEAVVCVCGCLAQREAQTLLEGGEVNAVVGTAQRKEICSIVQRCLQGEVICATDEPESFEELQISDGGELTRGTIKIQEGCNNFCSYCIIPYVRGRARSRRQSDIVSEAKRLVQNGVQEIVLTGIHISSYGVDSGEKLAEVLRELNGISALRRIRLGSLEPHVFTEEYVRSFAQIEKLCPHFHVSLQSGSDSVLARMNRKYTAEQYADLIAAMRRHFENPAISTDVIVGFPGETQQEFEQTCAFVRGMRFARVHVFPYSKRQGTQAAQMSGQICNAQKKERAGQLIAIAKQQEASYLDSFVGSEQQILLEQRVLGGIQGYTTRYARVILPQGSENTLVTATITAREGDALLGEVKD